MYRKNPLATGEVYHVFNKSIAGFVIFNNQTDYNRMISTIRYYQAENHANRLSRFIELNENNFDEALDKYLRNKSKHVEIIAYCIMPTHIHLIIKQLKERGTSTFLNNVLNSYTRYFNAKHKRKGPLWEGRFKNVLVKTNEQLLHLTRYVHLNPVTAYLIDNPELWVPSSYKEYLETDSNYKISNFTNVLDINTESYKKFVENRISYQRDLAKIKELLFEETVCTAGVHRVKNKEDENS